MKECLECSKCCEGWLYAKIFDNILSPTNVCNFLTDTSTNRCSIHESRPIKPCRIFNCSWISNSSPDYFKPSLSGVIMKQELVGREPYIVLINAPNYPSQEMVEWCKINYNNFLYFDQNDDLIIYGSDNFKNLVKDKTIDLIKDYQRLLPFYIKDKE